MTPLVKTARDVVMAVSLLLASAAATADNLPVSTQVVDLANKLNGVHPGFRAFQAKGVVVEGSFKASPEAAQLNHAKLFNGPKTMSWDQENLKATDHGCPTAIYIVRNGVLEQCP